MLTGTLALLHRALRLDARLLTTHLFRLGFVVLVYFSLVHAQIQSLGLAGAPGLKLFSSMMYLNLGLIVLSGVSFFATAITEEKEEETLGLLRMAGLNPLALLLGKSTRRLIGTLLLLAVQIPFILLAVTLGGATIVQILAGYCTLASFLILTANMGLFASVACRRGGTASAVTVALFVLYFLGGPLFRVIGPALTTSGWLRGNWVSWFNSFSDGVVEGSAYTQLDHILSTGFNGPILGWQVTSNLGVAFAFFLLSWVSFNYYTHPKRQPVATRDVATRLARGLGLRRPRPRFNAIMWKEFHFITGGTHFLLIRFLVYGALVGGTYSLLMQFGGAKRDEAGQIVVCIMLGLLVIEACLYASRLLHDEWREHTLPMLMMLPIPVHQILAAKLLGCIPALLPGLAWLVISLLLWNEGQDHLANMLLLPSYWFGGLVFLLLLTLTLFFSLVVRWGALPLSIAVMLGAAFFGSCCFVPAYSLTQTASDSAASREAAFLVIDAIVVILIAGLQFDIHRRLEIAGSQ